MKITAKLIVTVFAGIAVGLGVCSIAGHLIPERLDNFTRFHIFVAPDSLYYPTVRSVYNTAKARASRDKPFVIVGGSSVLYGAGQPEGKTIADALRAELGESFMVMNLAMRDGDVAGMGLFIAETLLAEGYEVFYIADVLVGEMSPIGSTPYHYIYWQYRYEPFGQKWKPRDDFAEQFAVSEVATGQRLNVALRFNNLWNQLGYDWFFTVYSKFMNDRFWLARREKRDPEVDMPEGHFYKTADMAREIATVSRIGNAMHEDQWDRSRASWNRALPPQMRPRTLLVLCKKDPRVTGRLDRTVQDNIVALYDEGVRRYRNAGLIAEQPCKDFEPGDYVDTTHLSPQGARKLSRELAKSIRAMAHDMVP